MRSKCINIYTHESAQLISMLQNMVSKRQRQEKTRKKRIQEKKEKDKTRQDKKKRKTVHLSTNQTCQPLLTFGFESEGDSSSFFTVFPILSFFSSYSHCMFVHRGKTAAENLV